MSKKTKKEKILAEYRRKLKVLETLPQASSQAKTSPAQTTPVAKNLQYQWTGQEVKNALAVNNNSVEAKVEDLGYVVSDLKRILFLAGLAICAQVVLWYFLRK